MMSMVRRIRFGTSGLCKLIALNWMWEDPYAEKTFLSLCLSLGTLSFAMFGCTYVFAVVVLLWAVTC